MRLPSRSHLTEGLGLPKAVQVKVMPPPSLASTYCGGVSVKVGGAEESEDREKLREKASTSPNINWITFILQKVYKVWIVIADLSLHNIHWATYTIYNIFLQKHDNSILTVKNKLKLTDTAAVTVAENNFTTFTVSTTWLGKHGYILSAVFNNQILNYGLYCTSCPVRSSKPCGTSSLSRLLLSIDYPLSLLPHCTVSEHYSSTRNNSTNEDRAAQVAKCSCT